MPVFKGRGSPRLAKPEDSGCCWRSHAATLRRSTLLGARWRSPGARVPAPRGGAPEPGTAHSSKRASTCREGAGPQSPMRVARSSPPFPPGSARRRARFSSAPAGPRRHRTLPGKTLPTPFRTETCHLQPRPELGPPFPGGVGVGQDRLRRVGGAGKGRGVCGAAPTRTGLRPLLGPKWGLPNHYLLTSRQGFGFLTHDACRGSCAR